MHFRRSRFNMIATPIPVQAFETVRDQIGTILTAELANQSSLLSDPRLNATVWVERFIPFDQSEIPAVNISLIEIENIEYNPISAEYMVRYDIDVFNSAKQQRTQEGDVECQQVLQRICGLIRSILTHPRYKTLDLPSGTIGTTKVETIGIADLYSQDGTFSGQARITFMVKILERNTAEDPIPSLGGLTNVRIELTDRGYRYILEN